MPCTVSAIVESASPASGDDGSPDDDNVDILPRLYILKPTDFSQARRSPGERRGREPPLLVSSNLIKIIESLGIGAWFPLILPYEDTSK